MVLQNIVADLHLHSKYSRAVSPKMVIPEMSRQARIKGIDLLATGDWFHSVWAKQIEADLEEWSEGLYQSKENPEGAKFILSAEISCIYTQANKQRRVHMLVFVPSASAVNKINQELLKRGCNLTSDGRPIIGLSVQQLAEIVFSAEERSMLIPAHIWTPWFSLYGSKSGFNSLEEAFGEYAERIFAVETGLSSDPAMNWRIKELENRAIVSFSDAHSGTKMGREATVLRTKQEVKGDYRFSYEDIYQAFAERYSGKNHGSLELAYTIEFYPEEGKYHYTGHRNCEVIQSPEETRRRGTTCHVCGKPLTVGVMHRVEELAKVDVLPEKRESKTGVVGYFNAADKERPGYIMMVPLLEILSEVHRSGVGSKKVAGEYERLIDKFGSEFEVLMKAEAVDLKSLGGSRLAEAITKVRGGKIAVSPGYDGVFGKVNIWSEEPVEKEEAKEQMTLF